MNALKHGNRKAEIRDLYCKFAELKRAMRSMVVVLMKN